MAEGHDAQRHGEGPLSRPSATEAQLRPAQRAVAGDHGERTTRFRKSSQPPRAHIRILPDRHGPLVTYRERPTSHHTRDARLRDGQPLVLPCREARTANATATKATITGHSSMCGSSVAPSQERRSPPTRWLSGSTSDRVCIGPVITSRGGPPPPSRNIGTKTRLPSAVAARLLGMSMPRAPPMAMKQASPATNQAMVAAGSSGAGTP